MSARAHTATVAVFSATVALSLASAQAQLVEWPVAEGANEHFHDLIHCDAGEYT